MSDRHTSDSRVDGRSPSRREYLAAVAGLGAVVPGRDRDRDPPRRDGPGDGADGDGNERDGDPAAPREDFLWFGAALWQDDAAREPLFAFAARHDLAVVLTTPREDPERLLARLELVLRAASDRGLAVWLDAGLLKDVSADDFVGDDAARAAHLDWLRTLATLHGEHFDTGRVILWQEAPVIGRWTPDGAWNRAAVANLRERGPRIFVAQRRAIRDANDALDVGLFVHFPYVVDSKRPEVFESVVGGIRDRGVEPDFGFVDFYRGWYEKDVGPERADAAVRSLVANTRSVLGDRPVFYLGQCHTINPNHTPSKDAMLSNLRASLAAGASGLGWYVRGGYVPTRRGFDPFAPNVPGADVSSETVNTFTVARDRFLFPWLATLATGTGFDPDEAFDLWLVGDRFGFRDHRLSLRTREGQWAYVGDVGGYADGDVPEGSPVTDRATVFRGLDRSRFLADGVLDCRLETAAGATETVLRGALAMPCDPGVYVTERAAARLVHESGGRAASPAAVSLGGTTDTVALVPGERRRLGIPVDADDGGSLARLRYPEYADVWGRLASVRELTDDDRGARFDLWLRGTRLGDPSALPSIRDRRGSTAALEQVGVVAASDEAALVSGLDRDRFLGEDGLHLGSDGGATVEAAFAMPAAGRAGFRPPAEAAAVLAAQPRAARRFSLDYVVSGDG